VKTSQVALKAALKAVLKAVLKAALEKLALEVVEAALALEAMVVEALLPRQEAPSAP